MASATEVPEENIEVTEFRARTVGEGSVEQQDNVLAVIRQPLGLDIEITLVFRQRTSANKKVTCEMCKIITYPDGSTLRACWPVPCPKAAPGVLKVAP